MQGFGPATYGDAFADVYDRWYGTITDAAATAAFVASRVGPGPILELGVGTGRLVPALRAAGCQVVGLDASAAMLTRCVEQLGEAMLVRADLAHLPLRPGAGVGGALCAFNTLFNLPSATAQHDLLRRLGEGLVDDGAVIIEAITGTALDAGPSTSVGVSQMTTEHLVLSATVLDNEAQTIQGQHVDISERGIQLRPWLLRWTTPRQLDELAASAGLRLAERYGDWDETPMTDDADKHISVYRRV